MKTFEQFVDEGYAVIENPKGFTVHKTATVYSRKDGKHVVQELSGNDYNVYSLLYKLAFLFRHGMTPEQFFVGEESLP